MTGKRSYGDGCGAAQALDLVGERWALLVVRELVLGPKRFTDLRAGLPGISPNVLTQRLEELETGSVLKRRRLPPPASAWVYELTDWGQDLGPILMALGHWAARSPHMSHEHPLSVDSLMLSFRTMFDGDAAAGIDAEIELRMGDDRYRALIADGAMLLTRGNAQAPDAVIDTDKETLAGVVYLGMSATEATRAGHWRVSGSRALVKRFVSLFPLPAPEQISA